MKLHFGFDLDNTLINFDLSAVEYSRINNIPNLSDLNTLRKYLTLIENNQSWTKAQSWIYTEGLQWAKVSPGATDAIQKLLQLGFKVSIISHKTEFGPDEFGSANLRKSSKDWISESALSHFFPKLKNVYFVDSIQEKINMVQSLDLSHYLDDLLKIFLDSNFPRNSVKSYIYKPECSIPKWLKPIFEFKSLNDFLF